MKSQSKQCKDPQLASASMQTRWLVLIGAFLIVALLQAQPLTYGGVPRTTITGTAPPCSTQIRWGPLVGVGIGYAGLFVGLDYLQRNAWWKDQRGPFHFQDDWDYAKQADKAGHFFGGYFLSYLFSEALMASGIQYRTAFAVGAVMGWLYQGYVEVQDGFATNWGFSPSDFASNTLGVLFFYSQTLLPALQHVTPKWQYFPPRWIGERPTDHPTAIVDDYNGTTIWLSFDVFPILPKTWQQWYPKWLNLAIGYAARNVGRPENGYRPERRIIVGLDYNLLQLYTPPKSFFGWLWQTLNYVKLPSPAVEFSRSGVRFLLLYPFF